MNNKDAINMALIEGFGEARQLLDGLRSPMSITNEYGWRKLYQAGEHLRREQVKLGDEYFAEVKEAA